MSTTVSNPKRDIEQQQIENSSIQHNPEKSNNAAIQDVRDPLFEHIDEKKVLRKMDLHLMPMLTLLYLFAFLDRGNIGNAKIEGLIDDLHLEGSQYNWCCTNAPIAIIISIRYLLPVNKSFPWK